MSWIKTVYYSCSRCNFTPANAPPGSMCPACGHDDYTYKPLKDFDYIARNERGTEYLRNKQREEELRYLDIVE